MKKKSWLIWIILLWAAAAAAVFWMMSEKKEEPAEPEAIIEPEMPVEETGKSTAPFTGLEKEQELNQRPVMAVINNHPHARPQTGLTQADMVFELLAEGNVTRFLALYQSDIPNQIGPIRSARDYFVQLAANYDAFFVAHGYRPDAKMLLDRGIVDHINGMAYDGTLFQRSTDRIAPHNSYISFDNIKIGMDMVDAEPSFDGESAYHFYDNSESAKLMEQASLIEVAYGSDPMFQNLYTYDETTHRYSRSSGGVLTGDKESLEIMEIANVVFFETVHDVIDEKGRLAIDLESGGDALVFHGGGRLEAEWTVENGMLVPVQNGEPVKLAPGKTWIHLIPENPGLDGMVSATP